MKTGELGAVIVRSKGGFGNLIKGNYDFIMFSSPQIRVQSVLFYVYVRRQVLTLIFIQSSDSEKRPLPYNLFARCRCYGRRSHEGYALRDVYVPAHLYGQLALTKFGMENLVKVLPRGPEL